MDNSDILKNIEDKFSWHSQIGQDSVKVSITPDLIEEAIQWLNGDCIHEVKTFRRRNAVNGSLQIFEFCLNCGLNFGSALPHKNFADIESIPFIEINNKKFEEERELSRKQIIRKHYILQSENNSLAYELYLASEKWRSKCRKVMDRAQGVCEGCLEAPATQVHHLSYNNAGDEFMFELVALCRPCHERFHENQKRKRE